jgi:hypothetical protein
MQAMAACGDRAKLFEANCLPFKLRRKLHVDYTPHDLRRTALTGMARLGIEPIVLGHVVPGITVD